MDAICFVLRTGCQWYALNETGLCSRSAAQRRCQEGTTADVVLELWQRGLVAYEALQGIAWAWLARDGAMTQAPLGGKKVGQTPTDRGKSGPKRSVLTDGGGVPSGLAVEGANRNAFKMARETMRNSPIARPAPTPAQPQGMCLDKGYDDDEGATCWSRWGARPPSAPGAKRSKPSNRKRAAKRGGGWWSGRRVG